MKVYEIEAVLRRFDIKVDMIRPPLAAMIEHMTNVERQNEDLSKALKEMRTAVRSYCAGPDNAGYEALCKLVD